MTPLEKAARALAALQGADFEARSTMETPGGEEPEEMREGFRDQARAVLQAIREPGDAIAWTGAGIIQGPIGGCAKAAATQCFAGMIDAILETAK